MRNEPQKGRVFVSYSHDSTAHVAGVQALVTILCDWGADVAIDTAVGHPKQGWAQWSVSQLIEADCILMVCTATYKRRVEQQEVPGRGLGATWEGHLLRDMVYESPNALGRIGIVLLGDNLPEHIPMGFKSAPQYRLPKDSERLRQWICAPLHSRSNRPGRIEEWPEGPLGTIKEELDRYAVPAERELAAYLHDLEDLRDLDQNGDGSEVRKQIEERIVDVKRDLRSGPSPEVGLSLDNGTYELQTVLGTGGFGTVWLAVDKKVKRTVAVKLLKPEHVNDRSRRDRFFRGARVMAGFDHPNIVRVFDAGRIERGHHFFVMEHVARGDLFALAKKSRETGALSRSGLLSIIVKVAEALSLAHQRGIIHRDIKPANILSDTEHSPKITDFDLVYAPDTTGGTQAEPMGTYLYSSPEVLSDPRAIDARADIYSLGMTLLFCMHDGRLSASAKMQTDSIIGALSVPKGLKDFLLKATASDPARRHDSMVELALELKEIQDLYRQELGPIQVSSTASAPPTPFPTLQPLGRSDGSIPLAFESVIGRSQNCTVHVNQPFVSSQHAILTWVGRAWMLKDLGSRNGTFVDGERLGPHQYSRLRQGAIIAFGRRDEAWQLTSEKAPEEILAINDAGECITPVHDLLILPSSEREYVTIFRGARGWSCEKGDAISPLQNGAILDVSGTRWRILINARMDEYATASDVYGTGNRLTEAELVFSLSRDEEYIGLRVECGKDVFDAGARRANYLLLTLARRRLGDEAVGLPKSECGWVHQNELEGDPSMAPPQMNIDVYRIRKQLATLGFVDAVNIVERRPADRQLRIGVPRIRIVSA
jgi:serine/threonine protein kinase